LQIKNGDDYFPLFSRSSEHLASRIGDKPYSEGLVLRWQEVTWLPVLVMFGKHSLWLDNWHKLVPSEARHVVVRKVALLTHYLLQYTVARRGSHSWGQIGTWFVAQSAVAGWIEPQFLFNHYQCGRDPVGNKNDKAAQVQRTVNYSCRCWLEQWLHVSLAYQIEHHLTPKIPSDHLATIAPDVQKLCATYGLPYRASPFEQLLWEHTLLVASVPRERHAQLHASVLGAGGALWFWWRRRSETAAARQHKLDSERV
jgi:fatty acid desaturase